ncbi:hypothetical protein LPJ59_003894 [Coemansia sp. RSA 2399]|nr:hypothetical protein LPJ59_003894 [Coemansia sp. RSA 2399]
MHTNPKIFLYAVLFAQSLIPYVTAAAPAATGGLITLAVLNAAVPAANSTSSCSNLPAEDKWPSECVDNTVAVTSINKALSKYSISRRADVVAILSWMAYESGSWKNYQTHYPSTIPGQGTRCMMSWTFVSDYAKELYPDKYATAIGQHACNATEATDAEKDNVLALVTNNDDAFAAGFWFLVNQSGDYYTNKTLVDGDYDSFLTFNNEVLYVGTDPALVAARKVVWDTVNATITLDMIKNPRDSI